ncbi:MAG: hypothetical protein AAF431_17765, partial [Pseudomonadota bacterium]
MRDVTYMPLLAGALAAISTALRVSDSLLLSFDSWVYWEAAISLMESLRYEHLNGEAVQAWPPLYSVVLALWGKVAGLSVFSIKALNVLLSFFGGYLWMRV